MKALHRYIGARLRSENQEALIVEEEEAFLSAAGPHSDKSLLDAGYAVILAADIDAAHIALELAYQVLNSNKINRRK